MKKKLCALLSALVVIAMIVGLLGWLTVVTERKGSFSSYGEFYAQQADYDVLFFGSSHMFDAVSPLELWRSGGIVSYNMGMAGAVFPTIYWQLVNLLDYTTPKVVVIDCWKLATDQMVPSSSGYLHTAFDSIPLSAHKVQAMWDLMDGNVKDMMEFLWTFTLYHDRWPELTRGDFAPDMSWKKGYVEQLAVADVGQPSLIDRNEFADDTVGMEYLEKAIALCRDRGIDVLLTYLPFIADEERQREANRVRQFAEERGVDYIGFLDLDVVDYRTDMFNQGHLNVSGAQKITEYLGSYLTERYGLTDHRGDAVYAKWAEDCDTIIDHRIQTLSELTDIRLYLSYLRTGGLDLCLYVDSAELWQRDSQMGALLENLGADLDWLDTDGPVLVAVEAAGRRTYCLAPGQTAETAFGPVALVEEADGAFSVTVRGMPWLYGMDDRTAFGAVALSDAPGAIKATSSMWGPGGNKLN